MPSLMPHLSDSSQEISTRRYPRTSRGASRLTTTVFLAIGLSIAYVAYSIIPFYYYYFELQNQMTAIIPVADSLTDAQIRQRLGRVMRDLEIPAEPKDLVLDRQQNRMKISLSYEEVFYLPWGSKEIDLKVFPFKAEAEGAY